MYRKMAEMFSPEEEKKFGILISYFSRLLVRKMKINGKSLSCLLSKFSNDSEYLWHFKVTNSANR